MINRASLVSAGVGLLSVGCVFAQAPSPTATPISEPVTVSALPPATATATSTALPTSTSEPTATATFAPTNTPTPGQALTPTETPPTPTPTPAPAPEATSTPIPTPPPVATTEPTPTPSPSPTLSPVAVPTATATLIPNQAPDVEVLEFDGKTVASEEDLSTRVRPEEEFDVRVRGTDDDGNLAYLELVDEDGAVLATEECRPHQGNRCTVVMSLIAPDSSGRVMVFYALAADARGEFSGRVRLQAETRSASSGGGSSGGSSPPSPTPTPVPILTLSDAESTAGEISSHSIVLDKAPRGLSGFDITITVVEPSVARIVGVTFASEFDLTNEALIKLEIGTTSGTSTSPAIYQVHLFAADASQLVTSGMTDILFGVVELKAEPLPDGVLFQQTTIALAVGLLGLQDDENGNPINAMMSPGVLIVR